MTQFNNLIVTGITQLNDNLIINQGLFQTYGNVIINGRTDIMNGLNVYDSNLNLTGNAYIDTEIVDIKASDGFINRLI